MTSLSSSTHSQPLEPLKSGLNWVPRWAIWKRARLRLRLRKRFHAFSYAQIYGFLNRLRHGTNFSERLGNRTYAFR